MKKGDMFSMVINCFSESNNSLLELIVILKATDLLEEDRKNIEKYIRILEEKIIEINDLIK